jgi:sn-glycerol 3-phosphate transport system substrate-binding protein
VNVVPALLLLVSLLGGAAFAQRPIDIAFWHTLEPPGREALEKIVADFNNRQRDFRVVALQPFGQAVHPSFTTARLRL